MGNHVVHFAIHADDCGRAKSFYERVFGWKFEPWGPPDFWQIDTGGGIRGALQKREGPAGEGDPTAFECTIGVNDLAATAKALESAGARRVSQPFEIEGVGTLVQFVDTEGNKACAMQYAAGVS